MNEAIAKRRHAAASSFLATLLFGTALGAYGACTFRSLPGAITFNAFDPSIASIQTASTSVVLKCANGDSPVWQFSGSNGSAPLRMRQAPSFYIPYSVAASYVSGPAANQQWTITATVLGTDYQNAQVGTYSDLLTLTITP